MLMGAHVLLYSDDAKADRAFLRDVLELKGVDAGGGWLIFALPPAEVAVHPSEGPSKPGSPVSIPAELYLMCENVRGYVDRLARHGVRCAALTELPWGITTTLQLPSGATLGLYQPTHPTALHLGAERGS